MITFDISTLTEVFYKPHKGQNSKKKHAHKSSEETQHCNNSLTDKCFQMEKFKHFAVAKVKGQIFRYFAPGPLPYLQLSILNAQCWVSIGYRRRSMSHWATIVILTKQIT